jgi:tetratricopeptide (TPR) repeat protein
MRERVARTCRICAPILLGLASAPGLMAQVDGAPVSIGTYRVLDSRVLGEQRRLLVHLPRGYEGSAIDYPVVYHTYGDYLSAYYATAFATLEELADAGRIPPMILVGIDNIDRYRDLRPLTAQGEPAGADRYLRFLVDEVVPFVEGTYRANAYRVLVGPQAGAVFGLYALQERPALFNAFILNNPFTSPPNTALLLARAERLFGSGAAPPAFVAITFEASLETAREAADVYRLAELAAPAGVGGFTLHLNPIPDSDANLPPLGLGDALQTLFRDYDVGDRTFGGLAEVRAFYAALSARFGFDVPAADWVLARTADGLQERGELDEAVAVLEFETALYPGLLNGWWRLAGIAAVRGQTDQAIQLYEKCVAIDPRMATMVARRIEAVRAGGRE